MTPEELIQIIDEIIEAAIGGFTSSMSKAQREALNNILAEIAGLSTTKDGRIKPTVSNLKIKQKIKNNASRLIFGDSWRASIDDLSRAMDKLNSTLGGYFAQWDNFSAGPSFENLLKSAKNTVTSTLSESGLGGRVVAFVDEAMNTAITSGEPLRDLIEQFTDYFDGGLETIGNVNLRQVATDTLGQFNASYMTQAAERLGLRWRRYVGGKIKTTRHFCDERNGGYFHEDEISQWARLDWDGKNKATNSTTIFIYRGGWNCRHELIPVSRSVVPEKWKIRWAEIKSGRKSVSVEV